MHLFMRAHGCVSSTSVNGPGKFGLALCNLSFLSILCGLQVAVNSVNNAIAAVWRDVQDVLEHLVRDLALRSVFNSPTDTMREVSARELISPVLVAALACASSSSTTHPEFQL